MDNPTSMSSEQADTLADETPPRRDMRTIHLVLAPFWAGLCLPVMLVAAVVHAAVGVSLDTVDVDGSATNEYTRAATRGHSGIQVPYQDL